MTRWAGKPVTFHATYTMASSGLLTTMTIALGAYSLTFCATCLTMPVFTEIRSSRLMPGLRGRPAVITTTSEPAMSL